MLMESLRSGTQLTLKSMFIELCFLFITGYLSMTINRGKQHEGLRKHKALQGSGWSRCSSVSHQECYFHNLLVQVWPSEMGVVFKPLTFVHRLGRNKSACEVVLC